jgi:hypothetical protein
MTRCHTVYAPPVVESCRVLHGPAEGALAGAAEHPHQGVILPAASCVVMFSAGHGSPGGACVPRRGRPNRLGKASPHGRVMSSVARPPIRGTRRSSLWCLALQPPTRFIVLTWPDDASDLQCPGSIVLPLGPPNNRSSSCISSPHRLSGRW